MYALTLILETKLFGCVGAIDLEALRIQTSTEYVNNAKAKSSLNLQRLQKTNYLGTASELVKTVAPGATFKIVPGHYTGSNGISHVHFKQTFHDVEIDNALFNVNIDKKGQVFSFRNSFFNGTFPESSPEAIKALSLPPTEALEVIKRTLDLPFDITSNTNVEPTDESRQSYSFRNVRGLTRDPTTRLVYLAKPNGKLALTWKVGTDAEDMSYSSSFGIGSPADGIRTEIEDPQDSKASPFGWHNPPNTTTNTYDTTGNKVVVGAHPTLLGGQHPATSPNEYFIFPYVPDTGTLWDFYEAGVTQAFYVTNMLHDLYYILGFTPEAGNFQMNNNGEGGLGNDAVRVNVQKNGAFNNGVFFQEVDGRSPEMNIYPFDKTDPMRDSSFEAGILIHEYTHGSKLSDRMTGPPDNRDCLSAFEPDGMAEGWSDFYAAALTVKPEADRNSTYAVSAWGLNNSTGFRLRLYSTDMAINEYTYSSVNDFNRVHQVGTVWCTMLYEMLWNLIDKHGKNDDPRPDMVNGVPTDGKFLSVKLTTDGFALQPCNPSFVQARDAIIDADVALTGGENACEIWRALAKRGLGASAVTGEPRVDSFDLPEGVC
uniref:Extracellular metalloproteinase n=1 Tax=Bionectria ochroleuca TaxID=29856 RepID=A0A8H7TNX4_BIOOC